MAIGLESIAVFAETPLPTSGASGTPRDPSTLTLALIGAGTVAIYLALKRWPRKDEAGTVGPVIPLANITPEEDDRTRGAA